MKTTNSLLELYPPSRFVRAGEKTIDVGKYNNPYTKKLLAENIVIICKRKSLDSWPKFTWKEYSELCDHNPKMSEKDFLNFLADDSLLNRTNYSPKEYSVTEYFISQFILEFD